MRHGSLFSGIGGFDLAAEWCGWQNIFQVEIDDFCQRKLAKIFPEVKQYKDIKEFDGTKYKGTIDIISGGPPCQPISIAGKRRGTADDRWLWQEALRVMFEIKPAWAVFENPPGLLSFKRGVVFENLLSQMENEGYEVQSFSIPACALDAPHIRERIWIIAHAESQNDREYIRRTEERQVSESGNCFEQRVVADSDKFNGNNGGFRSGKISQFQETEVQRSIVTNPNVERLEKRESQRIDNREKLSTVIRGDWSEDWYEVAQRFCKLGNGISNRLVGCVAPPETHGIIEFIFLLRRYHYAASEEVRTREVLSLLQEAFDEKSVQRCFGRLSKVFKPQDLWCSVHGKNDDEGAKEQISIPKRCSEISEEELRELRNDQKREYSPYRRGLGKQCSCEFDDIVCELSHEIALGEWKRNAKKAEDTLYNLWQKSRGQGFLYEPLQALYEIWRSVSDKEIGAFRRHLDKRDAHRTQKIKSLGNAIVPQIAYEIFKAIDNLNLGLVR